MRHAAIFVGGLLLAQAVFAVLPAPGEPGAPADPRYCGEPAREALAPGQTTKPRIKRSRAVLKQFVEVFPCPTTLEHDVSCPGAAIDHTWPLSTGGCDSVANMTWLPDKLKSCAGKVCKDRWERRYYAIPPQRVNFDDEDALLRPDEVFVDD